MGTPEVFRSGHTPADPNHAAAVADGTPPAPRGSGPGPVPPENRPGHHAGKDQDKPTRRPPTPRSARGRGTGRRRRAEERSATAARPAAGTAGSSSEEHPTTFAFAFDDARMRLAARVAGVTPDTSGVEVRGGRLTVRFGRWSLRTPVANVAGTTRTGPYEWWKVAGPPHLSLADRGVTFATTTEGGLCIRFHEPVPAIMPTGLIRHPAATVTVADPDGLAAALAAARDAAAAATG
ncbi:MAG: hypothetical protein C0P77_010085 [Thermoanaerobacterales bacterium]